MKFSTQKLAKILFAVFILFFSMIVLTQIIPETKWMQQTLEHLENTQKRIMAFSGTTLSTSLAISALPQDTATPLATTLSNLNLYFVFMLAVVFVEKIIVVTGTKISLTLLIPIACFLYAIAILTSKDMFKKFANKMLILGLSLIIVIPFSTHFTEYVCSDYLEYVDATIQETDDGANKINEIISTEDDEATVWDKISNAFKTAMQGITDLLTYFKNVIKKCVNSIAIMLVTTFVLPIVIWLLFKWLLKELFSLNIPSPNIKVKLPNTEDLKKVKASIHDAKEERS